MPLHVWDVGLEGGTAIPLETFSRQACQCPACHTANFWGGRCRQALTLVSRQPRQAPLDQQLGGRGRPRSQHQPQVQGAVVSGHVHQALPPAPVGALELVYGQGVKELVGDDDGGQVIRNVCQAAMPVHLQRTERVQTLGAWPWWSRQTVQHVVKVALSKLGTCTAHHGHRLHCCCGQLLGHASQAAVPADLQCTKLGGMAMMGTLAGTLPRQWCRGCGVGHCCWHEPVWLCNIIGCRRQRLRLAPERQTGSAIHSL